MYRRNVERLFFAVAIFGIAAIAVLLPQLYDRGLDIAEAGDGSLGDPWTVCAAGCDYTTLTAAFADVSVQAGDYINVNATYASSTETFPLDFNDKQNITVSCQSSGAVVGTSTASQVDIQMTSSSAFNDCNLSNTRMYFDGVSSATISGNTFATSTTGTIYFTSTGGSGNTISNNTGINNIVVGSNQQSLTITSNTIQTYHSVSNTSTVYISNIENFTFTSNTVRSYDSSVNNLLSIRNATSSLISYNTFEYITAPAVSSPKGALYISDSTSSTISYNYILLAPKNTDIQYLFACQI